MVAILIITALIAYPLYANAFVSEPSVPTYSPEVEQLNTATTTQPDLERSVTSNTAGTTPTGVEEKILEAFPDAPIMLEVARCESQLDPLADRGNLNVDVGLFQINQVHLATLEKLGLDRRNIDDNIAYARILYDANGLSDWFMSRDCWGKSL